MHYIQMESKMKIILTKVIAAAVLLSGCTLVVTPDTIVSKPIVIVDAYVQPYCRWVDVPVYGYVDVYRDGINRVRIEEVAYVDRQWRCN
jgi:hypothetical protein